jgi:hypothetical protein
MSFYALPGPDHSGTGGRSTPGRVARRSLDLHLLDPTGGAGVRALHFATRQPYFFRAAPSNADTLKIMKYDWRTNSYLDRDSHRKRR